jgi:hypothetical protein
MLVNSVGTDPPRKPLTDFQPKRDFFQVPNDREGYCLGTVESAIVHWSPGRNENDPRRLGNIGQVILDRGQGIAVNSWRPTKTKESLGEQYLKDINSFAQNYSNLHANTRPQAGRGLAATLLQQLEITKEPQVLGFDQSDGTRHAVVVYDAEKLNGNIIFRVGDPNYPGENELQLIADTTKSTWTTGPKYPKDSKLLRGISPHIIHWDENAEKISSIPKDVRLKFMRLGAEVEVVVKELLRDENNLVYEDMAQDIGRKLELTVYYPPVNSDLRTGQALDRGLTKQNVLDRRIPTQADLTKLKLDKIAYEEAVLDYNRRAEDYVNSGVRERKVEDCRLEADKFNKAARFYNNKEQRSEDDFKQLSVMRETIKYDTAQFNSRLFVDRDRFYRAKDSLDMRRQELKDRAARLQVRPFFLSSAVGPGLIQDVPAEPLEVLMMPNVRNGPHAQVAKSQEGTTWKGREGTLIFRRDNVFVFEDTGGKSHNGAWIQDGANIHAWYEVKYPYATMQVDLRFAVGNGTANCEMKFSGVDYYRTEFTIWRQ